jgi:hypothetical protein
MTGFRSSTPQTVPRTRADAGSPNGNRPSGVGLPTRQRPRAVLALGLALVIGFAALGYWAWARAGSKVAVVASARDIPVGHTITRDDLTTAEVAGGVTAVSASHLSELVGQIAAVEIVPNTLIQRAMVTDRTGLSTSQAVVGVAVVPGQFPSTGLRPGEKVEVLGLPRQDSTSDSGTSVLADAAVVMDAHPNPASAGGALVSLLVPKAAAAGIAVASNAESVALVQVGG